MEGNGLRIEFADQIADGIGGTDQHLAVIQREKIGAFAIDPLDLAHCFPVGELIVLCFADQPLGFLESGEDAVSHLKHEHVGPVRLDVLGNTALAGGQTDVNPAPNDEVLIDRLSRPLFALVFGKIHRRMGEKEDRTAVLSDESAAGRFQPGAFRRHQNGTQVLPMHQVAASGVSPSNAAPSVVAVGQWTQLEENVVVVPGVESSADVVHPQGRGAEMVDRTGTIPGRFRDGGFNSRHGPVDPFLLRVFEVTASKEGDRHRQKAQARTDTVWDHFFPFSG